MKAKRNNKTKIDHKIKKTQYFTFIRNLKMIIHINSSDDWVYDKVS